MFINSDDNDDGEYDDDNRDADVANDKVQIGTLFRL